MRAVSGGMTAVFMLAVIVQVNDPDPIVWMAIYGAAALLSGLVAVDRGWRTRRWMAAAIVVAAIAALWSAVIFSGLPPGLGFGDLFASVGMKTIAIEEGREALGLAIIALGMASLAFWVRVRSREADPAARSAARVRS